MSLSPCHGHFHKLPLCYYAHGSIYDFGSSHDQDYLRIGCGWYDQQQHILIVILDPQDLEIDLHKPEVWDGGPPVTSNSNSWPRGWIWSARSSQNWELMLESWAPKSISSVILCLSTITGASLEHPAKWAMGSGLRKGTGATLAMPFCELLSLLSVLSRLPQPPKVETYKKQFFQDCYTLPK